MGQNQNFFKISARESVGPAIPNFSSLGKSDGSKSNNKSKDYVFSHTPLYGGIWKINGMT